MENFQYLTELLKRLLPPQADATPTPLATGAQMGLEEMERIPQNYTSDRSPTFPALNQKDALVDMARAPRSPARRPTELEDALMRLLTGAQTSDAERARGPM